MPKPIIFPCGGEGQPACPPTPAIAINPGTVVVVNEQAYVIDMQDDDDQGEDEQ